MRDRRLLKIIQTLRLLFQLFTGRNETMDKATWEMVKGAANAFEIPFLKMLATKTQTPADDILVIIMDISVNNAEIAALVQKDLQARGLLE
jgi:hypothetical protein